MNTKKKTRRVLAAEAFATPLADVTVLQSGVGSLPVFSRFRDRIVVVRPADDADFSLSGILSDPQHKWRIVTLKPALVLCSDRVSGMRHTQIAALIRNRPPRQKENPDDT